METVFYFHPSYLHIFHFPLHLLNEALLLSYLYDDLDYAQRLVDKHSEKGTPLLDKMEIGYGKKNLQIRKLLVFI